MQIEFKEFQQLRQCSIVQNTTTTMRWVFTSKYHKKSRDRDILRHKDGLRHQLLHRITSKEVQIIGITILFLFLRFEQLLQRHRLDMRQGPIPDDLCELPVHGLRRMEWIPPHIRICIAARLTAEFLGVELVNSTTSFTGPCSAAWLISTHIAWIPYNQR